MFCTQCGKKNPDAAQFCSACGTALASEPSGVVPPIPPTTFSGQMSVEHPLGLGVAEAPSRAQFAGFWVRFAAHMLDSLVVMGVSLLGAVVLGGVGLIVGNATEAAVGGYYIIAFLASWLYWALSESSERQATLGKRAVGVVVTDTAGRRISFARATGRAFSKFLNALTLGIGWIMVGVTAQKRGLHDLTAGTVVVRAATTPRAAGWVVIAVVCCALAIPFTGIVAAIAVPGLLRARMAGNEAVAIGSLRAINSAQQTYQEVCGGYAANLPALTKPTRFLSEELTGAETVFKSGYHVTLVSGQDAVVVPNAPTGCEGAVTGYFAQAVPATVGSSGIRYFATNASGTIYQDTDENFTDATALE